MLIKKPSDIPSSEITPKSVYMDRRRIMTGATLFGAALATAGCEMQSPSHVSATTKLTTTKRPLSTSETPTPQKDITNYNTVYEYSTDKYGPAELSRNLRT